MMMISFPACYPENLVRSVDHEFRKGLEHWLREEGHGDSTVEARVTDDGTVIWRATRILRTDEEILGEFADRFAGSVAEYLMGLSDTDYPTPAAVEVTSRVAESTRPAAAAPGAAPDPAARRAVRT